MPRACRVGPEDRVVHRLVGHQVARPAADAEPRAGLRLGARPGDGVHRQERVGAPPRRRDAGRGGQGHLNPAVRIVGRRDLADPRVRRPRGAFELDGQRDLLLHRGRADTVVPQVEVHGADAVGHGEHHIRVRRGETGIVTCVGQGGGDDVGFERPAQAKPTGCRRRPRCRTSSRMPTPDESAEVSDSTSPS